MGIKFVDVWKRRHEIQPILTENLIAERAKGRNRFLVFLTKIRDKELIERIVEIQSRLSSISCIDPIPKDYFHITVKACGFLAESKKYEDDVLLANLQKILKQAKERLHAFTKFNVSLAKLNIFPEVVLIEVHNGTKVGELNKALQAIRELAKMEFDYPHLLPHVSIARFQNLQGFTELIGILEELRDTEFGTVTVDTVELIVALRRGKHSELETIHTFELG